MERYTKIYALPERLYCGGAPVMICAGALLKDSATNDIIAQLKFRNVSEKQISAISISLEACDLSGNRLTGVEEYQYLGLAAGNGVEFGDQSAIILPDGNSRAFTPRLNVVVFSDGSEWRPGEGAVMETLPKQEKLTDRLERPELAKQYQRDTSPQSVYEPIEYEDLWLCACGNINKGESCPRCKQKKENIFSALDVPRLEEEAGAFEKSREQDKKKTKKLILIGAAALAVLILVLAVLGIQTARRNSFINQVKAAHEETMIEAVAGVIGVDPSIMTMANAAKFEYTDVEIQGDTFSMGCTFTFEVLGIDFEYIFEISGTMFDLDTVDTRIVTYSHS